MPSYKLTYFDARGSAEPIRLLFAQAGIKYEDIRLTREQWPELKKQEGDTSPPFKQLPILEVDGKVLSQTRTIARYIAKQAGLAGANDWEQAVCDSLVDSAADVQKGMYEMHFETDETKKAKITEKFESETMPAWFECLEKNFLAKTKSGWLVGDKMTWGDILIFSMLDTLTTHNMAKCLPKYPGVDGNFKKVKEQPNIAKWLNDRPVTQF